MVRAPVILGTYVRVAVMHELQYRVHLVLQLLQTGVSLGLALVGLSVVFAHGDEINGWSRPELMVVVGLFLAINGLIAAWIQPGLKLLMEQVRQGTLDFTLLKPVDSQLLVSVQGLDPWKLTDVAAGMVLIAVGVSTGGTDVGAAQVAGSVALASMGLMCLYGAWVMLASLTFWFVRTGELLDIARVIFDSGRWPVTMYPSVLRNVLTFVVPVGLSVTLPAQALVGSLSVTDYVIAAASAAGFLVAARIAWMVGVRRYAGASS